MGVVRLCCASVVRHRPSARGCSENTLTDWPSTGNCGPIRCDCSQYANLHHPCELSKNK